MSKYSQTSEFNLEGRFLGFAAEEGYKLKLLRLSTPAGEYRVKLPKELRPFLYRTLVPGEWVQVSGYQKVDSLKGKVKLKAFRVMPIAPQEQSALSTALTSFPPVHPPVQANALPNALPNAFVQPSPELAHRSTRSKPDATILVCQKSDCCKRGAGAVVNALQSELNHRGLTEQVKIRGTGCMKQCKAGPNVVMPDKSRHTRIRPDEIPNLVEKHFPGTSEIAS
jgi:(2Fe-2S) ferredoxin